MATPSSAIEIEEPADLKRPPVVADPSISQWPVSAAGESRGISKLIINKTLASAANLVKLLPSSTVLVFEALSSSFTNRGDCYASNKVLTTALISLGVVSCIVFAFTDSFVGRGGKHYYGVATPRGFYVFNGHDDAEADASGTEGAAFEKLRARTLDYVHAFFSAAVFLALAFSDSGVQGCFFPEDRGNTKQLLENLPLGAAVLATVIFAVFPTTRKGIGYVNES